MKKTHNTTAHTVLSIALYANREMFFFAALKVVDKPKSQNCERYLLRAKNANTVSKWKYFGFKQNWVVVNDGELKACSTYKTFGFLGSKMAFLEKDFSDQFIWLFSLTYDW